MVGYVSVGVILALFISIPPSKSQLVLSVKEEQDPGTIVGNVNGASDDYTLTSTPYFELANGNLITKSKIDRESLPNDVIQLTAVSAVGGQVPIEISVNIIDINDHTPTFPVSPLAVNLTESSSAVEQLIEPLAEDEDSGQNADITYEIVSGDKNLFGLSFVSTSEPPLLYLRVLKALDRENSNRHVLNISAIDKGNPPRRGYLRLLINVFDINDNRPRFTENEYIRSFPEDTAVGEILFKVHATDEDQGQNGFVQYSIASQSETGTFAINSTTGEIILSQSFDYETLKSHTLRIEASDSGSPRMVVEIEARVDVINVNDNDPEITFTYFPAKASVASVNENVNVGSIFAIVSVTDPDQRSSKDVAMEIVYGNEDGYFELIKLGSGNVATMQVANNKSLNEQPSYNLTIRANDTDTDSGRFTLASMIILINSGENHSPKFIHRVYNTSLLETVPVRSLVTSVHAVDSDPGLNGRLVYSIEDGNDFKWFSIDRRTGLITTAKTIHFKQAEATNGSIVLQIQAKDETTDPMSDFTQVWINIIDENDNAPVFTESAYSFSVAENTIGKIGEIAANDDDYGPNGDVTYNLESAKAVGLSESFTSYFSTSDDGSILVLRGLDREYSEQYLLQVSATDKGLNSRKTIVTVAVEVQDLNDNDPTFYPYMYFVTANPNTALNNPIAKVQVSDLDSSDEGQITYLISANSAANYYSLDPNSGEISLYQSLTNRNGAHDILAIYARDSVGNLSKQNATVTVLVQSTQSEEIFERQKYEFFLLENANEGIPIGVVKLLSSQSVRYYISDGDKDSSFHIEMDSGVISVSNTTTIDAEISMTYNLTVVAESRNKLTSKPIGFTSVTCLIHIVDVNDNYPVFQFLSLHAVQQGLRTYGDTVQINIGTQFPKTQIYNAAAIDADAGENGKVYYSLFSPHKSIDIAYETGEVFVKPWMLSAQKNPTIFQVEILACDGGSPSRCTTLYFDVHINILDGIFSKPLSNIFMTISEKSSVNSEIAKLSYFSTSEFYDVDANVSYDLQPREYFTIFPGGEVLLSTGLDYETSSGQEISMKTNFEITGQIWERTGVLSLAVTDENDNAPVAEKESYQFSVKETAKPGDFVGTIIASDFDSGVHGSLVYHIQNEPTSGNMITSSTFFYCDRFSGNIYVAHTPDRSMLSLLGVEEAEINFIVTVTDQSGENSSSSFALAIDVVVTIAIDFEDRHNLSFENNTYYAEVAENAAASNILTVAAFDNDYLWTTPSTIKYEIHNSQNFSLVIPFAISEASGIIGLKNRTVLDREASQHFHLRLTARYVDGTGVAHADLFVRVTDKKDSPPVFTKASFEFSVPEDLSPMTAIGRVEARDGDEVTQRTKIRYAIASEETSMFIIDPISGYLFLMDSLDFETQQQYNFSVKSSDEDGNHSSAEVIVRIQDVNDNNPVFDSRTTAPKRIVEGYYNTPTEVATVRANDGDSGSFGRVKYSLVNSNLGSGRTRSAVPTVRVDPDNGKITLKGMIDREAIEELVINVRATDVEDITAEKTTDVTIRIKIIDANDNSPTFTSPKSFVLSTKYASRIGHRIGKITAEDPDEGMNGQVVVSLLPNAKNTDEIASKFDIDNQGFLILASPLSTETRLHSVDLLASDQGTQRRQSQQRIDVLLVDIPATQDRRAFRPISTLTVKETSQPGSYITSVSSDMERSSRNRFFLTNVVRNDGTEDNRLFSIDRQTGQLSTSDYFTNKGGEEYALEVISLPEQTRTGQPQGERRSITVKIEEENNNEPIFSSDTQRVPVSEAAMPNSTVTTVAATDADPDDTITYSIQTKSGLPVNDFVINPSTGLISVGKSGLDREKQMVYHLQVIADDGLHRSTTELFIDVEDVNDNPPKFTADPICFDIRENSPSGTFVGRAEAIDEDLNSSTQYAILNSGSGSDMFRIHETFGTISYEGPYSELDREILDLYILLVRATDQGGLFSESNIFIHVTDENDHPPVFSELNFDVSVRENIPIGTLISTIAASDSDLDLNAEVEYSIVSGNENQVFNISGFSGELRTVSTLDRERQSSYDLIIMANNKFSRDSYNRRAYKAVTITVTDFNDNAPSFANPTTIYVREDAVVGESIFQINAIDPDLGRNKDVALSLLSQEPDHGIFRLDTSSRSILINDDSKLDFEKTIEYNLTVTASDNGNPQLSSTVAFTVQIIGANDRSPTFSQKKYVASVAENSAIGTLLLAVNAEDLDSDFNGNIVYSIVPSTNSSFVYINKYTGEIFIANFLDHETLPELRFEVEARDSAISPRHTTAEVVLTVQDENDCVPEITPAYSMIHVKEKYFNPAEPLLRISASDQDSDNNGVVDIRSSLQVTPDSDAFALTRSIDGSASLVLRKALDREVSDRYEVTITAVDRGSPPEKGVAVVVVLLTDVNDNLPEFDQYEYRAMIAEGSQPGTLVCGLRATDLDGSEITYRMAATSDGYPFYINPSTGKVFTRSYLDREAVDSYNLTINAFDKKDFDGVQNMAEVTLYVKIEDVNDNTPSFNDAIREVFVSSSNSIGTVVILEAFDSDEGANGRITYSLTENSSAPFFAVNGETGEIKVTKALKSGHKLQVHATDNGIPSRSSSMNISIYLADASQPTFTQTVASPHQILENRPGVVIGVFQATSLRSGSGSIEFHLIGDRYDWFSVNKLTGQLKVVGNPDREVTSEVILWIEARDSGSPYLSSYQMIEIKINDENDNPPIPQNDFFLFHINEGEMKTIATMNAVDPDEGNNGLIQYNIISQLSDSPEKFSINSVSGVLRNIESLDREEKSNYRLVVRISDEGSYPLHSDVIVHIAVDDVNDEPPEFTRLFSATITEDAEIGDFVVQVTTTDQDQVFNHAYELVDDSDGHFSIDRDGVIKVAKKLDREVLETHNLEVTSRDDHWTAKTGVTVRINDANDNPPIFASPKHVASVSVDARVGTVASQVNASDDDIGFNGQINYRISGWNEFFTIDANGQITTLQPLRCESGFTGCPVSHSLLVTACDSGSPNIKCGFCTVTIDVKSVNIHSPEFDKINDRVALLRSTVPGTKIYKPLANDADPGTIIAYMISSGNDASYFSISPNSEVTLERSVNSMSPGQTLRISITAVDDGIPSKSAMLNVIFEITGQDSHSPLFPQPLYIASTLPENSTIGTFVIGIQADDEDDGINGEVNYEIVDGNNDALFIIERNTGVLRVAGILDYEKSASHDITVRAFDSAMMTRSSIVNIRIPIEEVDDHPRFNASTFEIRIHESTPRDEIFATFEAEGDSGINSTVVRYSTGDATLVGVGPVTGELYLNSGVDYETTTSYAIPIYAESTKSFRKTTANVFIYVLGSNEYAPNFLEKNYQFVIPHLAGEGTEVGVVEASDSDAGVDGIIEYTLMPSSDSRNFRLDKHSGNMIVLDGSSYSVGDILHFTAVAKNPTTSSQSCLLDEVSINVTVISNDCRKTPCQNNATCMDTVHSVVCNCLPGYTGKYCSMNINDCEGEPCVNGLCEDLVNEYRCSCETGFTGQNCDVTIDHCTESPCMNGGTCLNQPNGFICACSFGAKGETCEVQSLNFPAQSFVVISGFETDFSLEFATASENALLLFSDHETYPFISLEIIDQQLQMTLRLDESSQPIQTRLKASVSDGQWHTITITKDNRDFTLLLDDCSFSEMNQCYTIFTAETDVALPNDLTLGGVESVADLKRGVLSTHDFVGCLRSIALDSQTIISSTSTHIRENYLVTDGCGKTNSEGVCSSVNVCQNGATCIDLWTNPQCNCVKGFEGQRCEKEAVGQTFTGGGFASISFTESYIRDTILVQSSLASSRKRRSVSTSSSSLEIRFRTIRQNSFLITAVNGDSSSFAALFIKDGLLQYRHKILNGFLDMKVGESIDDGNWHTVALQITLTNDITARIAITLDGTVVENTFDRGSNTIDDYNNPLLIKNIFVGGIKDNVSVDLPVNDLFKGCLLYFKIDQSVYQLNPSIVSSTISLTYEGDGVTQSCNGVGLPCDLVTCENGYSCVADVMTVSKCICSDGYVEVDGSCTASPSQGGLELWVIVIIAVLAVILVTGALLFAICFKRRRERKKSGEPKAKENGTADSSHEFQSRMMTSAPDLLPDNAHIIANGIAEEVEVEEKAVSSEVSSSVALVPIDNEGGKQASPPPSYYSYGTPRKETKRSGRRSANDILKNERLSVAKRPASAQANLTPAVSTIVSDGFFSTPRRQNKLDTSYTRTLPTRDSSRRLEYSRERKTGMPERPNSRRGQNSSFKKQKRKSRDVETLEFMMQELSNIAGLTREEVDLLQTGPMALSRESVGVLFDDGSSISTSSITDMSMQSRTTNSSRRVKSFILSPTPQNEPSSRSFTPGGRSIEMYHNTSRPGSRSRTLADEFNNLAPFQFPPPISDSDTDNPKSTSESDSWGSVTSEETAMSSVKKACFSDTSTATSASQQIDLDINFPSNTEDYFTTLVDIFEDLAQLESDETQRQLRSEDPSRRPSVLPGFVSNEISLWSEIEALSKRPFRRTNQKRKLYGLSQLSVVEKEAENALNPTRKTGSRMNSPIVNDIIHEERTERRYTPSPARQKSPTESIENSNRRNTSLSSSGRSNKGSKITAEFVKYI